MTHLELIKKIIRNYQEEFNEDPTEDEKVKSFRQGMIFAFNYLIEVLKDGGRPYTEED